MSRPIEHCGPFVLREPLGAGGMGEVWLADGPGDLRAAVKRLLPGSDHQRALRRLFHREVRVAAALVHPHIALIYDVAGADEDPWLAMELASGGSLADHVGRCSWAQLRGWLDALLQALAHVHARGILHRDVKPENVLICSTADTRPGVKLADFGVAWPLGATRMKPAGTPDFWAPEQAEADWRRSGPWTDLYAVGRTALSLAGSLESLDRAGAGTWVRWLLEPDPRHRPQRAADALRALRGLAHQTESSPPIPDHRPRPPFPWERQGPPPSALPGVGSSLGRLRERPLVGRATQQRWLGERLEKLGGDRWVELVGPPGSGRSSLATWLARRCQELGAAEVIRIEDSWSQAVAGVLRAEELGGAPLRDHLVERLRGLDVEPLARWLEDRPDAPEGEALARAVGDALQVLVDDRPWLVLLPEAPSPELVVELRVLVDVCRPVLVVGRRRSTADAVEGTTPLAVPALSREELADLLDATLQLEPVGRAALIDRAGGNPNLLLELLWTGLENGSVRPGTAGFEVELTRLPHLPRTLADAAQQRLEHGLAACSAEAISVAWLATLLPPRFDPDQLAQAAGTLGVSQPVAAISELRRARILRVGARGAGFATMALQRALRAQLEAQEPTVQRALAGAAADALGRVLTLPQRIERGRLLKVAGRDHEARKLLEQTAWNLHMRGIRLDLVRSAATWLVELADEDPGLRARAKALQSRAEERMGNLAAAVETALEAVALARTCDDPFVLQEALASAVYPLGQSGRRAEARRLGEESLVLARTLGQPDPLRRALFQLAFFLAVNGDPERGLELLDEAETLTDERHPSALINVAIGRSTANSELGRLDEALDAARDAATLARSWGSLLHRSRAQTSLGSLLQGCGDFEGAAAAYEQVVEVNRLMGVVRLTPRANLATIRIELGQNDQAVALLRSVLPHAQAMSQGPLIHAVHCFLLPALAGVGDWEAVDRCLEDLAEARRTVGYSERGLARFLDLGAERCEAAGHRDRAVLAWTEARAMWAKLGRDDRVAVADAALAR